MNVNQYWNNDLCEILGIQNVNDAKGKIRSIIQEIASLKKQLAEALDKVSRRNMQVNPLKKFKQEVKALFFNTCLTPQEAWGEVEKLLNR